MADIQTPYRVLARKYRPGSFDELIGQDALVRTLKNAIESNRIAHAFMLTGVRGVGKTTTARIIAKALNYTGPDGKAGPTTQPTDDCAQCQSITEGRHPDVMEMDAASRTGVDDIREILDGVRYAPTAARYKIYIIDEVHMLSKGAFNALLKTLEEPPPHVKFIFATTEIRKVPVTVLSRCQRFDLRRVEIPVLEAHYGAICGKEGVKADPDAIAMIARAADGSVRDGLSLLDQAIALGGGAEITADQVQAMLGLADRGRVLDLLEDLPAGLSPEAMTRAMDCAGKLSMPSLGRAWQILLKGLAEVNAAPNPQAAAEMVLIRLIYAADLPDPADLLKRLKDGGAEGGGRPGASVSGSARTPEPVALRAVAGGAPVMEIAPAPFENSAPAAAAAIDDLRDVVSLLEQNREMMLAMQVRQSAHLVRMQQGVIELRLEPDVPQKMAADLSRLLSQYAGARWVVSVNGMEAGAPTIAQQDEAALQARLQSARQHPVVAEILALFPGAKIDLQKSE
ncbi:MAG: DNA polymerase III subunit gamma/tau [Micavibrio aeruginosavorus]|nr:DNA polymerase III subunit gamma/tau [Micavibrio aeruginosavorus]